MTSLSQSICVGQGSYPRGSESLGINRQHWRLPAVPFTDSFGKHQLGDPGINIMPRIGHWRVVGYISSQLSAKRHVALALELWQAGRTGEVLSAHTYHHGLSSGTVGCQDSWRCTDHSCGQRCVNGVGELGVLWVLLSNVLYHLGLKNGKKQE